MKTDWKTKKLGEVLEYEQPTPYIVSSKNYSEDYETPVLTAGKSFILGKTKEKKGIFPAKDLPVIIFDDFTTATKFVDFPFKVKSSAMKILRPVKNISDAKFLFYMIQNITFDHTGIHKRYWISEYSNIEVPFPSISEQKRVAKKLDEVFEKVVKAKEAAEKNLQNSKELFESYLNNVFANPGKDWGERKLGDLCTIKTGKKDVNEGNPDGKYPFFTCARNHTYSDSYSFDTEAILIAGNGDVGHTSYYKGKFEAYQRTYVLFDFRHVTAQYLFHILRGSLKKTVSKQKLGNTMPYIKMGMLTDFKISFPTKISEQNAMVRKLDSLSAATKKLEKIYQQKLADLEELKKSILSKAFHAEL